MIIKQNFSLKNYNTFRVDVYAEYFVEINNNEELKEILSDKKFSGKPKLIIGEGSNILFTKDYKGIVIHLVNEVINIADEDDESVIINASAGSNWHSLVNFAVDRNLGGIENLSLIPGNVGAAPIQNIGAYGQELKDVFDSLNGIFINSLEEKTFLYEECEFGYRSSIFKGELKGEFVITGVSLRLKKNPSLLLSYGNVKEEIEKLNLDKVTVKDVSQVISRIRREKLPDYNKLGNAGSFFKNPEIELEHYENLKNSFSSIPSFITSDKVKIPAAWLIEEAGLKGIKIGNAGTYNNQALVIVNYGGASGEEILKLKEIIKIKVKETFGIELEEEVNII
jgi:UDP-N-acetylmuramate dehydrogenase